MTTTTAANTELFGKHTLNLAIDALCRHCDRCNWEDCRAGHAPKLFTLPELKRYVCGDVQNLAATVSTAADEARTQKGADISALTRM